MYNYQMHTYKSKEKEKIHMCSLSVLWKGAESSPSSCTLFHQTHSNSRVSCQKGPICHASAWRVGPFWQVPFELHTTAGTLPTRAVSICSLAWLNINYLIAMNYARLYISQTLQICCYVRSSNSIIEEINGELFSVYVWVQLNKLILNLHKTQYMLFSPKCVCRPTKTLVLMAKV